MISLMTSVWLELSELMSQLLASMVRSGKDLVYSDCESSFFFLQVISVLTGKSPSIKSYSI